MRFKELGLKMGDVMQLQISADSDSRFPVKLLGFIPKCSVIISAPVNNGKTIFLKEEQIVTLRFVVNNAASGFSAKVLSFNSTPKPYIHLEMPQNLESVEVRNAVRVNTELAATMVNETHKSHALKVIVANLSILGGRFTSDKKVALIGDKVSLTATIDLDEMEKIITIDCEIRNKGELSDTDSKTRYWYGFNFIFADDEDRLLLKAFVYQEILRSLHLL